MGDSRNRPPVSLVIATGLLAVLVTTGCDSASKDPVKTATKYIKLGERTTTAGLQKRYRLLSDASRQTATSNEYVEHFKPKPKGNDTCYVIDSISVLTGDSALATYRRVRTVLHDSNNCSGTPVLRYYTLVNEHGKWRIVWENRLLRQTRGLFDKGLHDEALTLCDKALELNPYSAGAYNWKAWCYARKRSTTWDEMLSRSTVIENNARKALSLEPGRPRFYNTLSLAFTIPELEIDCYQKALASRYCTDEGRKTYYGNIANTYLKDKEPAKAIPYADSALMVDSTDAYALTKRGRAENMLGRYTQAKTFFDRALSTDWQEQLDQGLHSYLFRYAAQCKYGLKDYPAALEHILRSLEMNPSSDEAQELYKSIRSKLKE